MTQSCGLFLGLQRQSALWNICHQNHVDLGIVEKGATILGARDIGKSFDESIDWLRLTLGPPTFADTTKRAHPGLLTKNMPVVNADDAQGKWLHFSPIVAVRRSVDDDWAKELLEAHANRLPAWAKKPKTRRIA